MVPKLLDVAENVVPASAVQTRSVISQFIEDFVHFKRREDGLNQHGGFDGAVWDVQSPLGIREHIIPKARFQVTLHFRQVKVRPGSVLKQLFGVVEDVERKVKQSARHRRSVHEDVFLLEMPTTGTHHKGRDVFVELIRLAFGTHVVNRTTNGIPEVQLPLHGVLPSRRIGVFEVGHKHFGAGVQGVDDHFPVAGRSRDFHTPVLQVLRHRRNLPVSVPNVRCFCQKVWEFSGINFCLARFASL
ncbi:hypothetical protein ALPO108162_11550 [Alicyclobacillus pomorum]